MRSLLAGALAAVTGCFGALAPRPIARPYHERRAAFVEAEYAPYSGKGTAAIEGQAFLSTIGGDTKKCAGRVVALNPVTSYSREWFESAVIGGSDISPGDERIKKYQHVAAGDADGRFVFENLPAGSYFVTCVVQWQVPSYSRYGGTQMSTEGGYAYAQVTVAAGQRARVIVTR